MSPQCTCPVCVALRALPPESHADDLVGEAAASLPWRVRRVLAAQARVAKREGSPADVVTVELAAKACTAARFGSPA